MKKEVTVKFLSAIICDDVRKEDNMKEIIIGVYTGNIVVFEKNATITLCVWLYMEVDGNGSIDVEFRGFDPSGRPVFKGKMAVTAQKKNTISSTLPPFHITVDQEGPLKIQYRKAGGRWTNLLTKKVVIQSAADKS